MTPPLMILVLLIVTTLGTAVLSGVIGMGGGILLLALMASVLEPMNVVPVHGLVQLTSNLTRTLRLLRHVGWGIFGMYVPTLFLGALAGRQLYVGAGADWFRPVIGGFVLAFLVWDRFKPQRLQMPRWVFVPAGFVGGVLTVVVGATGPYLAAFFLRDDLERHQVVATKAAIQTVGHLVKIPVFVSLGFAYRDHLGLILPLVAAAIAGTFVGTALLTRLPERAFQIGFRVVLTALGLRLLVLGLP